MKNVLAYILCFVSSISLYGQELTLGNITHQGNDRDYRLFIPSTYDGSSAIPLVFNLHGVTSNAAQQEFYSNMNSVAEENNFFVCYPNGIDAQWNVGFVFNHNWDDVDFISSLIDELGELYEVDKDRVYSCGMSNGGFMSYQLACELNNKIAAIASVTGSMVPSELESCQPDKGVPVMQIHGTDDATVTYQGMAGINVGIDDLISFWTKNNGCNESGIISTVDDTNDSDQSTATRTDYTECDSEAPVVLYKIEGGEHTWPGALINIGVTNQDFDASTEIWNFFKQFSLDISATTKNVVVNKLAINPNPVINDINFSHKIGSQYLVLDMAGRHMLSGTTGENIDVSNLKSGIYILKIEDEHQIWTNKFVKL